MTMTSAERNEEAVRRVEAKRKAAYDQEVFDEEQNIINGENYELLGAGVAAYSAAQRLQIEQESS